MKAKDSLMIIKGYDEILEQEEVKQFLEKYLDYPLLHADYPAQEDGIYQFRLDVDFDGLPAVIGLTFLENAGYKMMTFHVCYGNSMDFVKFDVSYHNQTGTFLAKYQSGTTQDQLFLVEYLVANAKLISYTRATSFVGKENNDEQNIFKMPFVIEEISEHCVDYLSIDNHMTSKSNSYLVSYNGQTKMMTVDELKQKWDSMQAPDMVRKLIKKIA